MYILHWHTKTKNLSQPRPPPPPSDLSLDPTMDIGKLSAALADGWKAALPSVKRQFEDMAREDEKRYKEDVR